MQELQISLTSRSDGVTNSMKEYANEKLGKLEKYFGRIHSIDAILDKEHDTYVAEIKVHLGKGGRTIVGKETHSDMIAAIDLVLDKTERQIRKLKEKVRDHRAVAMGEASQEPPSGEGGDEETYEDVVRSKDF